MRQDWHIDADDLADTIDRQVHPLKSVDRAVGFAEVVDVNRNHRADRPSTTTGPPVMRVTLLRDKCHVRRRNRFHRPDGLAREFISAPLADPLGFTVHVR